VLSSTSRITQERSATMLSTSRLELTNIIGRMRTHPAEIRVICKSGKRVLKIVDAIKSGIAYRCSNSDRVIIGDQTMFRYDLFSLSFNFHY
jgi:hypothetical protein